MSAIYVSMHTTRRETVFEACTFDGDQSILMCTGFILDKITLLHKEGEKPFVGCLKPWICTFNPKISPEHTTLSLVRACFHFFKVALVENVIAVSRVGIFHSSSRPIITALDDAVLTVSTHISNIPGYYGSVWFFFFFFKNS